MGWGWVAVKKIIKKEYKKPSSIHLTISATPKGVAECIVVPRSTGSSGGGRVAVWGGGGKGRCKVKRRPCAVYVQYLVSLVCARNVDVR